MNKKGVIWDLPLRIFHWLLAIIIIAQWLTAEVFEGSMEWHFYLGYAAIALVLFRFIWGFTGPHYARFSTQLSSIKEVIQYSQSIRQGHKPIYTGHNPIGAWFLPLILALVTAQATSGLFISDDVLANGPYYDSVTESTQSLMNWLHHNVINLIWLAILIHLVAIFVHQVIWKEPLIKGMIDGKKPVDTNRPTIYSSKIGLAVFIIVLCSLAVYGLIALAPEPEMYYY